MKAQLIGFCIGIFGLFNLHAQVEEKNSIPISNASQTPQEDVNLKDTVQVYDEIQSTRAKKSSSKAKTNSNLKAESQLSEQSFFQTKSAVSYQTSQRSPTVEQQSLMNDVVAYYQQKDPNSFEFHYFKYVAGNYDLSLISHLLTAQKLKPNNVDVQVQLVAFYYIEQKNNELNASLLSLKESGRIENEPVKYATDLLESTLPNSFLVTHGFDDTYAALYAQSVHKIRTDVTVISADFLQSTQYRDYLKKKGFEFPNQKIVDVEFMKQFIQMNQTTKQLHVSMTFPKPYLNAVYDQLSIVGLTFYAGKLDKLFERNKTIFSSYINLNEVYAYTTDKGKKLTANYLPLLLSLQEGYKQENNSEKVKELDNQVAKIKAQAGVTKKTTSY